MSDGARVGRDGRVILASEDREAETLAKARKQARRDMGAELRRLGLLADVVGESHADDKEAGGH